MTRTAGLHALADILDAVQIGQFVIGEECQRNSCVEASGYTTALARLIFEGDLYSVYSHWCGCAPPAKVSVQLTHGLLY